MTASEPTRARLRDLLEYDPETGLFVWRVRTSNRVQVGDVAGAFRPDGYIGISIDRRITLAHRLAFLYMTGELPSADVDHINGSRTDNRWCNLRHATRMQNLQNTTKPRATKHGLMGVTFDRRRGKYIAQITTNYVYKQLGRFNTAEEAHASYLAAKRKLHVFQAAG